MSKTSNQIEEKLLHAYVDHQLSEAETGKVENWLAEHPEAAARVQAWESQNMALAQAFDKDHFQHIPERLSPRRISQRHSQNYFAIAAAVLLIVASGLLGWLGQSWYYQRHLPVEQFVDSAANAYRVYSPEIKYPVEMDASQQKDLQSWLSRRINHKLTIPDLHDEGFMLVGGRLLANKDGPAALLMYQHGDGKRITMYAVNTGTDREVSYQFVKKPDLNAYYWSDHGISYALTGPVDKKVLKRICDVVYDQMEMQL